jgi:hypothetical protein
MQRKLTVADEEVLKQVYLRLNIPSDQYKRRPDALRLLTEMFNDLTERADQSDDLLHHMISRRKKGKWPRLGSAHKKLAPLPQDTLSDDEWAILDSVYLDINEGSDHYAYDAHLRSEFTRRFSAAAGRVVPARVLCAAIEKRRKEGFLPRLTPKAEEPFGDMDAVAL